MGYRERTYFANKVWTGTIYVNDHRGSCRLVDLSLVQGPYSAIHPSTGMPANLYCNNNEVNKLCVLMDILGSNTIGGPYLKMFGLRFYLVLLRGNNQ